MAAAAKSGSSDHVGHSRAIAVSEGLGLAEGDGEGLSLGVTLGLGEGEGLAAGAPLHPARTSSAIAAGANHAGVSALLMRPR
jgi:hypothetical protein